MKRFISITAAVVCLFAAACLFFSADTVQTVWADSLRTTKPVLQTDGEGNTSLQFKIDAPSLTKNGYRLTSALYRDGQMVDVVTKHMNIELGEVTLDFGKTAAFDTCKLFAVSENDWEPLMKSVQLVDGVVTTPIADQYGFVIELMDAAADAAAETPALKLFLTDGTTQTFPAADFNRYDAEAVLFQESNGKRIWNTDKISAGAIVRFGTNERNEINIVKGVAGLGPELVLHIGPTTSNVSSKGYWDSRELSKNVAIFTSENWSTGESVYLCLGYQEVLDSDNITATSYIYNYDTKVIEAMVVEPDFTLSGVRYGVIDEIRKAGGDTVEVNGFMNGRYVSFQADQAWADSQQAGKRTELYRMTFGEYGHTESLIPFSELTDDSVRNLATGMLTGPVTMSGMELTYAEGSTVKLAENCRVYLQKSGFWDVGSVSDIQALNAGLEAEFYDVYGNDSVYDIALIREENQEMTCAAVVGLQDQTAAGGIGPKIKLLSAENRPADFEIAPLGQGDKIMALFEVKEGALCWNHQKIMPGSVVYYSTDSAGRINAIEGTGGLGTGLESWMNAGGMTYPIEENRFWNGKEFAEDTVIYASWDVLDDPYSYEIYGAADLKHLYDLTAYSYLAKDDRLIAIVVKENFSRQGDLYGIVTELSERNGQVQMKGYVGGVYKEFTAEKREVVPRMLLDGDFSGIYQIRLGSDGIAHAFTLFEDAVWDHEVRRKAIGPLSGDFELINRTFRYGDEYYVLDRNYGVYVFENGAWRTEERTYMENLKDGDFLELYDMDYEDGIYDTVIIRK